MSNTPELIPFDPPDDMKFPTKCCVCGCHQKEIIMVLPGSKEGGHMIGFACPDDYKTTGILGSLLSLFCGKCWKDIRQVVEWENR